MERQSPSDCAKWAKSLFRYAKSRSWGSVGHGWLFALVLAWAEIPLANQSTDILVPVINATAALARYVLPGRLVNEAMQRR